MCIIFKLLTGILVDVSLRVVYNTRIGYKVQSNNKDELKSLIY